MVARVRVELGLGCRFGHLSLLLSGIVLARFWAQEQQNMVLTVDLRLQTYVSGRSKANRMCDLIFGSWCAPLPPLFAQKQQNM